jgi:hypothetical protein
MNRLIAAAFLGSALMVGAADAMPLTPLAAENTQIIQVAGGCGRGLHRGPFGGCRRNWANPAAHACPRGYHVGPYGGCRGNGR